MDLKLWILHNNHFRGAIIKKKTEKFGKNSQLGLTPLPHRKFQTFLKKKLPPPPLGNFSQIFPFFL